MSLRRVLSTALAAAAVAGLPAAARLRAPDRAIAAAPWESGPLRPLHARAVLRKGDARHTLELWRDGSHVRRETDGGTLVSIASGDDVVLLQPSRGLALRAGRSGLAHLGAVEDWRALATLAGRRPGATVFLEGRGPQATSAGECRWYRVERQGEICWSSDWSLALLAHDVSGADLELEGIEATAPAPALFSVPPGTALVDADRDIAGDD